MTGKAAGREGGGAVAADRRRLDAGRRPGARWRQGEACSRPASFRISAGKLVGAVLKVPVAPVVTARADATSTVSGAVKPLAAGTAVELQVDSRTAAGRRWRRPRPDRPASTRSRRRSPALYRVRVAPAQGFAEGLSGQIELPVKRFALVVRRGGAPCARCADAARYAVGARVGRRPAAPAARALPEAESLAPTSRARRRAGDARRGCRSARRDLRRAARRAPARLRPERPAAAKQWHLTRPRVRLLGERARPALAAGSGRGDRLGHRRDAPGARGQDRQAAKSFVGGSARVDREGHGTFVAGLIAAAVDNAVRDRGHGADGRAARRQGRRRRRPDRRRGRGQGDPLGGPERRAGDQPEPRRPPRPARPATGTRSRRSRRTAIGWAHGRASSSSPRSGTAEQVPPTAVAVRELSRGAAARPRGQRARPRRLRPSFSNRDKIYNDIAAPGAGDRLDVPARADRGARRSASSRATRPAGRTSAARARGRRSRRRR